MSGRHLALIGRARVSARVDAETLVAAMSVTPTAARQQLIVETIAALHGAGLWSKLDVLWVMAAHDSQAAGLNWKSPSNFVLSPVNAPTFTADQGYAGNASSSYLNTGFQLGVTAGSVASQNSAHLGVWVNTDTAASVVEFGNIGSFISVRNVSNFINGRMMSGSNDTVAVVSGAGHTLFSRSGSTTYARYKDGSSIGDATRGSTAPGAFNLFIGALNNSGTPGSYSSRQIAVAHAGAALSAGDAAALYGLLDIYLSGL